MGDNLKFISDHTELFGKLLNYTFDALLVSKLQGSDLQTVFANQTYYSISGLSEDNVIGSRPRITASANSANNLYDSILKHFKKGSLFETECTCLNKAGSPFWAIVKSFPLDTDDEKFCVTIIKEITIRKKRENELKKALQEAKSSKIVKDKFLANMSHEMRTPLNGILGMTQLLEGKDLDEENADYVEEIKLSAENLLAIVNDILEFNFLKSTNFKLENRKFNIRKLLRQVVDNIRSQTEEKGLDLELVISKNVPEYLVGDSVRLSQVLMNILSNSIKFTKNGEIAIFVTTGDVENGKIPVKLMIKDTGIGIPDSMINNIFESFSQVSKSTSYKFGGAGLGLSLVKQLVGYMDGKIDVESTEGVGTAVSLQIPFYLPDKAVGFKTLKSSETDSIKESFSGDKILIVDDYTVNRRIVKGMMKKLGVDADEAEDGSEALEMINQNNYSAVFMDVHMPGMGGLEATRRIREHDEKSKRDVPIIAITASVLDRDIEECKQAGMDGFIAKPFTYDELYNSFKEFIKNGRSSNSKTPEQSKDFSGLDLNNLYELTGGDEDLLKEIMELFLSQTPDLMSKIITHFNSSEYDKVKEFSHTLKPTFTYVGMEKATELTEKIESMAGENNPDAGKLEELISELNVICTEAINKVKSALSSMS
ncbi:response regulator [Rhodohalobacter sp.]|uniref:response regulator n=1 Tax=Rhodohalobacter sp. TaxID=1974210 RepID=UPI003569E7CF